MCEIDQGTLLQSIFEHDAFFSKIIDMIPKDLYKPNEEANIEENANAKYYKVNSIFCITFLCSAKL